MAEQPSEQQLWVRGESAVVRYCWECSLELSAAECDGHWEVLTNRPD
jgi:hypothetical protein